MYEQKKYEEEEDDDDLDIEDYLNTDKSNVINISIPSLRLDAVAKAGFGISRAYVIILLQLKYMIK